MARPAQQGHCPAQISQSACCMFYFFSVSAWREKKSSNRPENTDWHLLPTLTPRLPPQSEPGCSLDIQKVLCRTSFLRSRWPLSGTGGCPPAPFLAVPLCRVSEAHVTSLSNRLAPASPAIAATCRQRSVHVLGTTCVRVPVHMHVGVHKWGCWGSPRSELRAMPRSDVWGPSSSGEVGALTLPAT